MENSDKKVQMKVYIRPDLLEKLKYLHKREGPMNYKTKKRKPFSAFISSILSEHVRDRMTSIDVVREGGDWDDKDFA